MSDQTRRDHHDSADRPPDGIHLVGKTKWVDGRKYFWMSVGVALFCVVYFCPPFPDAVDPQEQRFTLSHEGKAALALFLLTATWWVYGVRKGGTEVNYTEQRNTH